MSDAKARFKQKKGGNAAKSARKRDALRKKDKAKSKRVTERETPGGCATNAPLFRAL